LLLISAAELFAALCAVKADSVPGFPETFAISGEYLEWTPDNLAVVTDCMHYTVGGEDRLLIDLFR